MSLRPSESNTSLSLAGKTAVVAGATQGIGEGIALRCAQLGASRIFIVGRNEQRGNALLEKLESLANQKSQRAGDGDQRFEFVKADLSTLETIKKTASDIQQKVGQNGLDYLLMTQGGPPNGIYEENSDGYDKSFVVQSLSRFGLAYFLAEGKAFKQDSAVVSVAAPGSDYPDLDLEDLSLKKLHSTKLWRPKMLISQGKRDSVVIDAFTMEFNRRYPSTRFYHLFPGYVQTKAAENRGFPFPIPQLATVFGPILARTVGNTPMSYSDIPLFFAANPEAKKVDGYLFNENLKKVELGLWNQDQKNRERLFDKLRSLF